MTNNNLTNTSITRFLFITSHHSSHIPLVPKAFDSDGIPKQKVRTTFQRSYTP